MSNVQLLIVNKKMSSKSTFFPTLLSSFSSISLATIMCVMWLVIRPLEAIKQQKSGRLGCCIRRGRTLRLSMMSLSFPHTFRGSVEFVRLNYSFLRRPYFIVCESKGFQIYVSLSAFSLALINTYLFMNHQWNIHNSFDDKLHWHTFTEKTTTKEIHTCMLQLLAFFTGVNSLVNGHF